LDEDLILVVDDDADVRLFIRTSLEVEGYKVSEASNGVAALQLFDEIHPAVVVLDLMLGQPDGLEVCRRLRQHSNVPIIMLTSRNEEIDEAMCLSAGANDYVTKPVSGRIIALRVAVQLRHRNVESPVAVQLSPSSDSSRLSWGTIDMDVEAREVRINSTIVPLTQTEFDLLKLLLEHPRQAFTRERLAPVIGADRSFGVSGAIDAHASRLRVKIRKVGGPDVVVAVRGVGYRLSTPV